MERAKLALALICVIGIALGILFLQVESARAQDSTRETIVIAPYTEYEWWLIRWDNNEILCRILVDHEGVPTIEEVASACGADLAQEWLNTLPCTAGQLNKNGKPIQCFGLYLYLFTSQEKQREIVVELPPAVVWAELVGCDPKPPENLCLELPTLVLKGEEPLPNERIIAIHGLYDGAPFYCDGDICSVTLRPTPLYGSTIEFWADSSYGDTSEKFFALIRVIDTGVSPAPGGNGWYVDIISAQWRGMPLASCAKIWEAFPPIGTPPIWLSTPERFELLSSDEPYFYLAGRMIVQGLIDISDCPSGGLLPNGYADACGLEKSRPMIEDWQNQFDHRIIEVSDESGIPAQLMKNLFAQESQFWPGVFRVRYEFGLGQITDQGCDVIFIWNPAFYQQFCPLVLSETACSSGYLMLTPENQSILRGALALQARANCDTCPTGVDLTNANFTVALFANTLQANCAQVSRSIYTATNMLAGVVSDYEDLWRFTIANYHAGPGCLSYALHKAWENSDSGRLTWDEVKLHFTDPCKGVIPYVEKITR